MYLWEVVLYSYPAHRDSEIDIMSISITTKSGKKLTNPVVGNSKPVFYFVDWPLIKDNHLYVF